jgi:hypothetical protein
MHSSTQANVNQRAMFLDFDTLVPNATHLPSLRAIVTMCGGDGNMLLEAQLKTHWRNWIRSIRITPLSGKHSRRLSAISQNQPLSGKAKQLYLTREKQVQWGMSNVLK